uniref:Chemosensory protein 3 n=1 Tax=Lissorhoptrus oryzophilus TaxID=308863 RepID=A0A0B4KZD1_9CUCU|nr:chemosensory protein 3 [Lissorhoptrus oryzophilus]
MFWIKAIFYIVVVFEIFYDKRSFCALLSRSKRAEMYTTKYDNIDVDSILASTRLLKNYVNCLLDQGPCSPEGKELKKYLPDAIATECTKCSEAQKKIAGKVFSHMLLKHRDDFEKITAKYDPERKIYNKYLLDDKDYADLEEA